MKNALRISLLWLVAASAAFAQYVPYNPATKELKDDIKVGSGHKITVGSGGTVLLESGASFPTGGSSGAWGNINGSLENQTDLWAVLNAKQASHATLTGISGLTFAANQYIYSTGATTFAVGTISTFFRTLTDDADAAAVRSTLSLGNSSTKDVGTGSTNVAAGDAPATAQAAAIATAATDATTKADAAQAAAIAAAATDATTKANAAQAAATSAAATDATTKANAAQAAAIASAASDATTKANAAQAAAIQRANHTGTQAASTISDSTTVGRAFMTMANPSAVRYARINADNSITLRTAAEILSDIGGGASTWGAISGTLASQTDLQSALDLKLAIATAASTYQGIDSDLTSWAAITRASGFDTFAATPTGANLASLLTTALPASKGGTGLTALSANVVTLLGSADYAAVRTSLSLGNVDNTSDANKPVSTATQTALDLKGAKLTFATLGSNALALVPTSTSDAINTATWTGTPVTLTYTGGSDTAGERQRLLVTVTTTTVLTVTPTSSTVYRNGSTTALGASTVSYAPGRYWITFLTPDTGTNLYMEDSLALAADLPIADVGTYYGTDTVEAALQAAGATIANTVGNGKTGATTGYGAYDALSVHGGDVVSASTTNLETATGNLVDVTGTTTITAITLSDGHQRTVRFTGALTLTAGANLILPNGGSNITTAAGDVAIFRGYASSVVRCVIYQRLSGAALSGSGGLGVPSGNGMIYGTSGGSSTARTLTSNSVTYHTWTNGDGASGNPTSDLTTRVKAAVDGVLFPLTIDAVADGMDYTIGYVPAAFTITELRFVHNGTTSSPSITPTVKYGTDRSSGTSVVTSPSAVTSTTTGASVTSFNNATPAANSWIWLTTASKSGTTDKFTVIVVGHY